MITPILSPVSLTSFYDPYDGSVTQAKLYFYHTASLDPITVWTDAGATIPYAQPILTGGSGRVPPVFIADDLPYRIRAFDQYDVLLEDIDGLPGAPDIDPDSGGGGGTSGDLPPANTALDMTILHTGDVIANFTNAVSKAGFVRLNGQTIGDSLSNATELASTTAHALFIYLWQMDKPRPDNVLEIIGGKGDGAESDWNTHKQLVLPDLRGRVIVGMDPMGNTATSGRMTGAKIDKGTISMPGCNGGVATMTLTINEMPRHNHGGTTGDANADHTHYVSGTTSGDSPDHTHYYDRYTGNTGPDWTYNNSPNSKRGLEGSQTGGASARHVHTFATWSGGISAQHQHAIPLEGGKSDGAPTPTYTTQPFNLTQPWLTLCYYMKL